jgi:hypothetical protein
LPRRVTTIAAACTASFTLVPAIALAMSTSPNPQPRTQAKRAHPAKPAHKTHPARSARPSRRASSLRPIPRAALRRLGREARALHARDPHASSYAHFRRLCREWRQAHPIVAPGRFAPLPRPVVARLSTRAKHLRRHRHGARSTSYVIFLDLAQAWQRTHKRPLPHQVVPAIRTVARRYGLSSDGMLRVARCESNLVRTATNGQYLGLFQLGDFARTRYLRGDWRDAYANAEAAARYAREAGGFGPWSCGFTYA